MSYCVSCKAGISITTASRGHRMITRCKPCSVKNQKHPSKIEWDIREQGGGRAGIRKITGGAPSKYCVLCGDKIPESSRFFALGKKGEARYCDIHSPNYIRRWGQTS